MRKLRILLIVLLPCVACKEMKAQIINEKSEGDWITLFNGSSFDHWRGYLSEEMYPEWTIEDGAMAFTPGERGGKNIISREKYTNFILSIEWKISEGSSKMVLP